jgi:hypothetical protein
MEIHQWTVVYTEDARSTVTQWTKGCSDCAYSQAHLIGVLANEVEG